MNSQDLILEIGTEELPPKTLLSMGTALEQELAQAFVKAGLAFLDTRRFAAPRRLAVFVRGLQTHQADQSFEKRGPAVRAAFNDNGEPTQAAIGFAASCGVAVSALTTVDTEKGDYLVHRGVTAGSPVSDLLPSMLTDVIQQLPVAKRMRWGDYPHEFVRPVKWLLILLGDSVIETDLFGVNAGRTTRGHRIHHPDCITVQKPADYEDLLEEQGKVIPNFEQRRSVICDALKTEAQRVGLTPDLPDELVDEVTALNEWPVIMSGSFDEAFLRVPPEALVSSMQDHQKYFPLRRSNGELAANFLFVANLDSRDPAAVIAGNERVIRPRLADAAFFWDVDKKVPLSARTERLGAVVFQKILGTLADKTDRIRGILEQIGVEFGLTRSATRRAAELAKCDLVTDLVFEFDDLQGIAGYYYALNDGESADVAAAIRDQYRPGHAGDNLPSTLLGQLLAVADRVDTLVGIFGIGKRPSGTRDPYALRRASLGVMRILVEARIDISLRQLLEKTLTAYRDQQVPLTVEDTVLIEDVLHYCMDRLKAYYLDQGISADVFLSVAAMKVDRPVDFDARIRAVRDFSRNEAASTLIQANKRVQNLLQKSPEPVLSLPEIEARLSTTHEQALFEALRDIIDSEQAGYAALLDDLSGLAQPLDNFFENVMVNTEAPDVRETRLALIGHVRRLFLRVADVSLLSP